jgi:hypothetical protein
MTSDACAQRVGYYRFYKQEPSLGYLFSHKVPDQDTSRARCYRAYFDRDGKLVKFDILSAQQLDQSGEGFCTVEFEYTDSSRRESYYNVEGERVQTPAGVHAEEIIFSKNSYRLYQEDKLGFRLTPDIQGCDYYLCEIDESGKQRRVYCMNDSLGPVENRSGFTSMKLTYDEFGNETSRVFEDDIQTVIRPDGEDYAMSMDSTFQSGEMIRTCYADESGNLLDTACVWFKQDANGYISERKTCDPAGRPLKWENFTTDRYGNTLSIATYDADHKLDQKQEWSWNSHNQVVRYNEVGPKGPVQSMQYEYDTEQRVTKISKFDSLGRPWGKSFAALRFMYGVDEDTRVVQFLGKDGELTGIEPDGIAQISYRYEDDMLMQISYHDVNAMPVESSEIKGWKLTFEYDGKTMSTATLWSKQGTVVRTYTREQLYWLLLMIGWNKYLSRWGAGSEA